MPAAAFLYSIQNPLPGEAAYPFHPNAVQNFRTISKETEASWKAAAISYCCSLGKKKGSGHEFQG